MSDLDTKAIRERAALVSEPGVPYLDALEESAADVPALCDALDAARAEVQSLRDGPCCPTCSDQEHNPESKLNLLRAENARLRDDLNAAKDAHLVMTRRLVKTEESRDEWKDAAVKAGDRASWAEKRWTDAETERDTAREVVCSMNLALADIGRRLDITGKEDPAAIADAIETLKAELDAARAELAQAKQEREMLREALKGVAKWCHGGHGHFPATGCGLCKPVLAALDGTKEPT